MDEILKMSNEINYSRPIYDFKGPTSSISFAKFGGPMYTDNQLKNGEKTLEQVQEDQKDFKNDFKEIT